MQDFQKNKAKLLELLKNREQTDSVEISDRAREKQANSNAEAQHTAETIEKKQPAISIKIVNSPTSIKLLNLFFWSIFFVFDLILGFIIYIYWL